MSIQQESDRLSVAKKMARLLFTVEDTFMIEGRGLVPLPGIVPQGDEQFRVGDPISLKRPDGSEIEWTIGGLELLSPPPPQHYVVVLLKGLSKDDVPIGTEIWSVDN
jgi:translation elongation factor EF-Tu-like GTPase